MMPEAHVGPIQYFVIFCFFLMAVIFGAVVVGRKRRKPEAEIETSTKTATAIKITSPDEVPITFSAAQELVEKETLLQDALQKTESNIWGRLRGLFESGKEALRDDMEEILLTADLGPKTTFRLLDSLEESLPKSDWKDEGKVRMKLKAELSDILSPSEFPGINDPDFFPFRFAETGPTVIMVVGVNGAGKTTTIGKLAGKFANHGLKVLVAAGDRKSVV